MNYVDSSVVLAYLLGEEHGPDMDFWSEPLVSSRLLEYEVLTTLNARALAASHGDDGRRLLRRIPFVALSPRTLQRALEPFPLPVRTLDALHLASIVFLIDIGRPVSLCTYDRRMATAAQALGIPLADL